MTKTRKGYQKLLFKKRAGTEWEEVDYEKWSLKKSTEELHSLEFDLTYPDEWINFESETGLKCVIGDEVELYASFGDEVGGEIKRFGGYIQNVNPQFDGTPKISITCKDYRYSLKNMLVFKDYYKIMPISLGPYSQYIQKMYDSPNLSEAIYNLCSACGFTDFSQLESGYGIQISDSQTFTKTVGTYSNDVLYDALDVPESYPSTGSSMHKIDWDYRDAEACFTLYSDLNGYDLNSYPYITLTYLKSAQFPHQKFGFRFKINGTYYYLPWFSDLSQYSGNKLRDVLKSWWGDNTNPQSFRIPLLGLMHERFPDVDYRVTKIELVHKEGTSIFNRGYLYIGRVGVTDAYQTFTINHDYTYKNGYELADYMAKSCEHYFTINPNKQPEVHNLTSKITTKSIIEGENLIKSDTNYDDEELANNYIVLSTQNNDNDTQKAILGQAVLEENMNVNGRYDKIEENSSLTSGEQVQGYAEYCVGKYGKAVPTYTCTIAPTFDINEGDIVYVYNPSIGVEKSLQVTSINIDDTGGCDLELGSPDATLITFLKKLNNGLSTGLRDGTNALGLVNDTSRNAKYTEPYILSKGNLIINGSDLVESGISLNNDMDTSGNYLWKKSTDTIDIDANGVKITRPTSDLNTYVRIPIGLQFSAKQFRYITKVEMDFTYTMTGGSALVFVGTWYSNYNRQNESNLVPIFDDPVYGPTSGSGSATYNLYDYDIAMGTNTTIPTLTNYHLLLKIEGDWTGTCTINEIRVEYMASTEV